MPTLGPVAPRPLLAAGLALLLPCGALHAQAAPVYHATFLGPGQHVAAVNDAGLVAYRANVGPVPRAWVAGPDTPATLLPVPFGFLSATPTDINEAGVISGSISPYQTLGFSTQPAVWHPDGAGGWSVTLLATLPGDDRGTADALNDVGDILGTSSFTSVQHTVLFTDAGTQELPGLGGRPARAVNDQRVYVTAGAEVVDLETLVVTSLGVPAGWDSTDGFAINDAGAVAGQLGLVSCGTSAAVHDPLTGWQAWSPCGPGDTSFDLTDGGDLLAKVGGAPTLVVPGQGSWLVEDLVADDVGHWTVTSSAGIGMNGLREIALVATNATTGQAGVVLLVPEPTTTCQTDLGSAGPGSLRMSLCGGDLSSGTTADLVLVDGPPLGLAWVFLGVVEGSYPFSGGTLVPVPWVTIRLLPLDATGGASVPGVPGGGGPFSIVLQAVVPDASLPLGYAIGNALRAEFLP